MQITLSPIRSEARLEIARAGDVLTINGEAFDFSEISEGATLPREAIESDWFASDVERIDGVLHLTLILPHGPQAPQQTLFPAQIDASDGPVALPPYGT